MPDGSDDESALPVSRPASTEPTRSPEPRATSLPTDATSPEAFAAGAAPHAISPEAGTAISHPDATSPATGTANAAPSTNSPEAPADTAPQLRDPDRYVILGEHGRGGLGRVSRAHDRELGRDIAIKELIARGDIGEARFLREALITARLEHPGIVPVHEAGRWPDGTPFYAMKLVAGRPLRDVLAEKTTVDSRIALLHHVIAVADAIAYAHGRNIIHRDLKPSNVIIGDFGETVVIDWGLAKDLTISDEPSFASDAPSPNRDERLTSTGSVLGTPAYMPPEQLRGEPVDQRADVYAIGAMLWELCSLEKLPPNYSGQRHRILRGAGIDQDLATIVQKALDPDPAGRYPDAGALAADLKAFKAGARIAARRYSPLAMLAHWLRRHRALGLSFVAAVVVGAAGIVRYVHDIGAQRDRADASEKVARRAQTAAETSLQELTLKHAQALLGTDPTEATDVLSMYRGAERVRADQLLAEARGRGVALLRAIPQTGGSLWTVGTPTGAVLSLAADGTLSSTSNDGTSTVLYRSAQAIRYWAYAAQQHLLAFACEPATLCLYDVLQRTRSPIVTKLRDNLAIAAAFSADEQLLALVTTRAVLKVLDITNPAIPVEKFSRSIAHGWDVRFVDRDVVAIGTPEGAEFVRLSTGDSEKLTAPGGGQWDSDAINHDFAFSNIHGEIFVVKNFPARVVAHRQVCHSAVVGFRFIPGEPAIGYACRDGAVGRWDLRIESVETLAQLEGHTALINVSSSGEYLMAAGGNGALAIIDLRTELTSIYRGHGFRLTSITPPTREFPFVVSADARGAIRKWPLPSRVARVIATSGYRLHRIVFAARSHILVATSDAAALTTYSENGRVGAVPGHEPVATYIEGAPDSRSLVTYGNDVIEIWRWPTLHRPLSLHMDQGSISQLSFAPESDGLYVAGYDGRVTHWKDDGPPTTLTDVGQRIDQFLVVNQGNDIVLGTADGTLWRIERNGQRHILRTSQTHVTQIVSMGDTSFYVGYADGDVVQIDITSWRQEAILRAGHPVRQIVTKGDVTAVAANGDTSYLRLGVTKADGAPSPWISLPARVSNFTFSGDLLIAVCSDGGIWMYSTSSRRWAYLNTGGMNLGWATVADDDKVAAAVDTEGHVIWIDLELARASFHL